MTYLPISREYAPGRIARWALRVRRRYESVLECVPTSCPLCQGRARGGRLCHGCLGDVTRSMRGAAPRCPICCLALAHHGGCPDCLLRAPAFERIIAAFDYALPGEVLIRHLKVANRFAHARMLAELVAHAVNIAVPAAPGHTILVPVPASRASIYRRGFNPAAEVARCLSWQLSLRYRPDLLLRTHEGVKQTSLSRVQRAQSAQRLYRCARRVDGAHIAVVDDVATTGSTLHSIAREFKAAGAASVCGLVIARTPYR
jgi:ComF family protein